MRWAMAPIPRIPKRWSWMLMSVTALAVIPSLYMLVMLSPAGLLLPITATFAGWGSTRAAAGRRRVPHPLAH